MVTADLVTYQQTTPKLSGLKQKQLITYLAHRCVICSGLRKDMLSPLHMALQEQLDKRLKDPLSSWLTYKTGKSEYLSAGSSVSAKALSLTSSPHKLLWSMVTCAKHEESKRIRNVLFYALPSEITYH